MGARRFCVSCVAVAVLMTLGFPVLAQEQSDEDRRLRTARSSKWGFFVAPYGWLTGVSGTVVTDGEAVDIDVPFEDFLANTRAGLQLYFEARHNRLFVAFDGTWATLGAEHEGRLFDIDLEVRQRVYDIRAGFQVHDRALGEVIRKPSFDWQRRGVVDVFIGGRYFRTEPVIEITPIIGEPREFSSVDSRVDPFVGLRVGWDMSYRWGMGLRGDIGGFGIGGAAQFSWQASAELGFRVSKRIAVVAGYRILEYDTVAGRGEDRNGTDLRQQGPIIGAGIAF